MFNGFDPDVLGAMDMHLDRPTQVFTETFRGFSAATFGGSDPENLNYGGKILLPQSALARLASLHIEYPMLFEITNIANGRRTHAGVLEFTAEEGRVYVPRWMLMNLGMDEGALLQIKSTSLPLGRFVKIQPQDVSFLDITDPKAVLEQSLRNFTTLTKNDVVSIKYNQRQYDLLIMEIKPETRGAVSIIETDLEVDFAPPVGYVEPTRARQPGDSRAGTPITPGSFTGSLSNIESHVLPDTASHGSGASSTSSARDFKAFGGAGARLAAKPGSGAAAASSPLARHGAASTALSSPAETDEAARATLPAPTTAAAAAAARQALTTEPGEPPAVLKLPPGKFFFGYPYVPPAASSEAKADGAGGDPAGGDDDADDAAPAKPSFQGAGQSLRAAKKAAAKR